MKRYKGFRRDGGIDRRWNHQPSNTKVERNDELFRDKLSGMSIINLMTKYGISYARIYQIVGKHKKKEKKEGVVIGGD